MKIKEVERSSRHLASKEDYAKSKTEMITLFVYLFSILGLMIIGLYLQ